MVEQTLTLAELQEGSLEQILQNVAKANAIVTVLLPGGAEVTIACSCCASMFPPLHSHYIIWAESQLFQKRAQNVYGKFQKK